MQWKTAVGWFDWFARAHLAGTLLSGAFGMIAGGSDAMRSDRLLRSA